MTTNDEINLASALNDLSKITLKIVIPSIGLKKQYEKVLWMKYVDECSNAEIAEELGMTYESASNFLCKARKSMLKILENENDVIPDDVKHMLKIYNDGN